MHTNRISQPVMLIVGGLITSIAALAFAQQTGDILFIEQPLERDVYAAHEAVEVTAPIGGDFVAAGQRVTVAGDEIGDVIVAAQNIEIRSAVSDDLRAAGQTIHVRAPVAGHVVAAGQIVAIEQNVGDWAWLAGDTVEVFGNVGGDLKVRARKITINSEVAGEVELIGDELELGPNSLIRGNLRWKSSNAAELNSNAQIMGDFIEEPLPGPIEELTRGETYSLPLNLIVAVIVLFLLFSRALRSSANRVTTRPGKSLLLGLAVFLAAPLLVALLVFTGIGVWLGFVVLFVYLVVLLLGVLTGLFAVSDAVLRRIREKPVLWQSLAAIFVTVVAVGLIAKVPWIGFAIVVAIWLVGVGALCWNAWVTLRSSGPDQPQLS